MLFVRNNRNGPHAILNKETENQPKLRRLRCWRSFGRETARYTPRSPDSATCRSHLFLTRRRHCEKEVELRDPDRPKRDSLVIN